VGGAVIKGTGKVMDEKKIGRILVEYGMITKEQLIHARRYQHRHGGRIGEVLVQLGYIENEDVIIGLSEQEYTLNHGRSKLITIWRNFIKRCKTPR